MDHSVQITWLGHACFLIESGGFRIVIDPYDPSVGYPVLHTEANLLLTSHGHHDHNYAEAVVLTEASVPNPFRVQTIQTWHDNAEGAERGGNLVHVLEADGLRIAHFGDLGHYPTDAQLSELGRCDVLLIPVGGHYTLDTALAAKLCGALAPCTVVPMHYLDDHSALKVLNRLDVFLELMKPLAPVYVDGPSFTAGAVDRSQIVVLSLRA